MRREEGRVRTLPGGGTYERGDIIEFKDVDVVSPEGSVLAKCTWSSRWVSQRGCHCVSACAIAWKAQHAEKCAAVVCVGHTTVDARESDLC